MGFAGSTFKCLATKDLNRRYWPPGNLRLGRAGTACEVLLTLARPINGGLSLEARVGRMRPIIGNATVNGSLANTDNGNS